MHPALGDPVANRMTPLERLQRVDHLGERWPDRRPPASGSISVPLGQPDHAVRQADPIDRTRGPAPPPHRRHSATSTRSIRRRCRTPGHGPPPDRFSGAQPASDRRASSSAENDLEIEAGLRAHPVSEGRKIVGTPAGLGCDGARPADAATLDLRGADLQRRDTARHRRLRQAAGHVDPLAQADDAAERVDHAKVPGPPASDQQAAVVGARGRPPPPAAGSRRAGEARPILRSYRGAAWAPEEPSDGGTVGARRPVTATHAMMGEDSPIGWVLHQSPDCQPTVEQSPSEVTAGLRPALDPGSPAAGCRSGKIPQMGVVGSRRRMLDTAHLCWGIV